MKHGALISGALLALLATCACASAPRPKSLDQSQAVSRNPSLRLARDLAPQGFAHAEQLRIRAEQSHAEGRNDEADALARQSLVAYDRAVTAAHRLELERQLTAAESDARKLEAEVARVAALQGRVGDETLALERSLELERTAEPRHPIEPESGERAAARAEAARSIAEAARLLCVSARLLAPQHEHPISALTRVEGLLGELPKLGAHVALERAMDARVECLSALSAARSVGGTQATEPDALLQKLSLSLSELRPHRDDRGIVLTDHDTWVGNQLSPHGSDVVARIADVVKANPHPVLVVVHGIPTPSARTTEAPDPDTFRKVLQDNNLQATVEIARRAVPSRLNLAAAKDRRRTEFILITSQ